VTLSVDLADRVALVTGGSQGIGAGIAEVLVRAGATVVTCARSAGEQPAPGTRHVQCDVRDPEAVGAMVEAIVAEHGRLDILVNNAGGSPYALAADASPRFVDKILGLNLTAPFLVAQAANSVMQRQGSAGEGGGVIVNISSVSALRPSPGTAAYGAAKAGVDSLTRSLAVEWGPRVRVNTVDVGLCRTAQTADHYGGDETVRAIEATIPLGRMAEPAEIGQVVAFLASDLASYVSGASVECHGGGEPPAFLVAQSLPVVQPGG
jgi:NAD(P)-dependent dehydrogenase (short-subunit alcohol dehydrogenase family)